MRRDVAGAARLAVVVPGAAHAAGLLEDLELLEASALEVDPHAETAGSGPDDRDAQLPTSRHPLSRFQRRADRECAQAGSVMQPPSHFARSTFPRSLAD